MTPDIKTEADGRFTVVFDRDIRSLDRNPHKIESAFGNALTIQDGDALAENDLLKARCAELEGALKYAVGLLPGRAGASSQPDSAVYTIMAAKGEITRARALTGGGNG